MVLICTSVYSSDFSEYETKSLCAYAGYAIHVKDKFMASVSLRIATHRGDSIVFDCGQIALKVVVSKKMPSGFDEYQNDFYNIVTYKLLN